MNIQLFGNFSVVCNGEAAQFRSRKSSLLLCYLVAHPNRAFTRSHLAFLFWGDYSEKMAKRYLTNALVRLKKALGDARLVEHLVVSRQTITFATSDNLFVDLHRFDAVWAQCEQTDRALWAERGQVVQLLSELAELYQGPFLQWASLPDSIEFDAWVSMQQQMYHERMLLALEMVTAFHLKQGNSAETEQFAKRQLTMERWHETAHRQLIRLYVQTGRPKAASEQYEQCKAVLWEELGVVPDRETDAAIAGLDRPNDTLTKPVVRDAVQKAVRQHNLPPDDTPFIGRTDELKQLNRLVSERKYRLITLVGQGGAGKTRLSLALSWSQLPYFADGVYFVSLIGNRTAEELPVVLANALGVALTGSLSPHEQVCAWLREREALIVLDNLEHLLTDDGVIDWIVELHKAAQSCVFLVTSRQQLWLRVETLFPVGGLSYPDSAEFSAENPTAIELTDYEAPQLFIERIQRFNIGYRPDADRVTIAQICQMVDGLPLALELAAAQSGMSDCSTVLDRIRSGMDALRTRMRDIPLRQRSLQAVFDYSWQLLSDDQQAVLAKLSVFRDGFDSEAIAAIVPEANEALLRALQGHSLLRRNAETGRYDLHEMVRAFAATHLDDKSAESAGHAEHYLGRLVALEAALEGEKPQVAVKKLLPDFNNIQHGWRVAGEIGRFPIVVAAANGLSVFLQLRGLYYAGQRLFMDNVAHARQTATGAVALPILLSEAARFHIRLGQNSQALTLSAEARTLTDETWLYGNATNVHAEALWRKADYQASLALLCALLPRLKAIPAAERILGSVYYNIAVTYMFMQNHADAQPYFEMARDMWRKLKHRRFEAITLNALGVLAERQQAYDVAETYYAAAIPISQDLQDERELAQIEINLAVVYDRRGSHHAAIERLKSAIQYCYQSGNHSMLANALNNLGYNYYCLQEYAAASTHIEEAWHVAVANSDNRVKVHVLHNKAKVALAQGNHQEALRFIELTLKHSRENNVPYATDVLLNEKNALTQKITQYASSVVESE